MEALRTLLIARTGYPRSGAVAQASRESGVAQSLLSQYLAGTLKPKPDTLVALAKYLDKDYDELLLLVWGNGRKGPRRQEPVTPHDQALRAVDVIAAAMTDLRMSLVAMAPASRLRNNSRTDHSSPHLKNDYLYQTLVPITHPNITRLWGRRHLVAA